jgi:hypothetical protein
MKKRFWVGGLVLSLGGWATDLHAQETVWRPARRPTTAVAPGIPVPQAPPQVSLGRPVPLLAEAPALVPAPARAPIVTVSFKEDPVPPSTVRAQAADNSPPAASQPPAEGGEEQEAAEVDPGTDFAIDRVELGRPAPEVKADEIKLTSLAELAAANSAPQPKPDTLPAADSLFPGRDVVLPGEEAVPAPPRLRVSGEYLLWWVKDDKVPPLVSTSSPADNAIIGQPTTQVLFGGDNLDNNPRSGARFTASYLLDPCGTKAIEVSGFFLGSRSTGFDANTAFFPVLGRPFFNLNTGTEFAELVTFPGVATGNVTVNNSSRLWGVEANYLCNLCCACDRRTDVFAGVRYLDLDESLTISENILALPTAPTFPNSRINVTDRFATHNQFYGGQIGVDQEWRRGRWFLDFKGKLALGDTHQQITIDGSQTIVQPNGTVLNSTGGLLALRSNIGHFTQDRFSVVPEVGLNLGFQFTDRLRAFVGYNFLYWSSVVRPGEQIDRVIDVTQIPNFPTGATPTGQARPAVPFKTSDFWAQGINLGLEFRY